MNQKIYQFGKNLKKKISHFKFDMYHKYHAKEELKVIELVKGKTEPKLIKLSNEYAKDIFGSQNYAPWLYVYSAFSETFKEGWIPDNYYGKIVVPKISSGYGKVSFLKSFTKIFFNSNVFPDIGYYVNGLFYSDNYIFIHKNNIKDFLFKNSNLIVFKLDNSKQGLGVFFLDKNSFDLNKLRLLGNGVFQEFIEQHPFFSELMANSVATIRITTILENNGNTSVRACFLRVGRKNDTHIKETSEIVIPVNTLSGNLDVLGYLDAWIAIDKHPDSQVLFANRKIPHFDKCISVALELQKAMPFVRCIGWDMTVDKNDNVKVMEWNGYDTDIKFSEATQGPGFSDLGWENLWKRQ
jgi:hypothetical protein